MKTLHLLYFARLRESLGLAQETVSVSSEVKTVADLILWLVARGGHWQAEFAGEKVFRVAVDQDVAWPETTLRDGAEVALFPPVTGG